MAQRGWPRALREAYFSSPFYSPRSGQEVVRDSVSAVDLAWPGVADTGRKIINGDLIVAGVSLAPTSTAWSAPPAHPWQAGALHGFTWLRDLLAFGGETARQTGRGLIARWLDRHNQWDPLIWRPDILGERLTNWFATFDFFCSSADDGFRGRLLQSAAWQASHASRDFNTAAEGLPRLATIRGLVTACLALNLDDKRFAWAERRLVRELPRQINADGGHRSRSPRQHCEAMMALINIRNGFRMRGRVVPPLLNDSIARMVPVLRMWRHGDGQLALFHRTLEVAPALLDTLIARSQVRASIIERVNETGFQRMTAGQTRLILDAGLSPGPDDACHASPLALEVSTGRHRLIVNCGTSHASDDWQAALRRSAAHSMLVVDSQDAVVRSQLSSDRMRPLSCRRHRDNDGETVELEHDGYRSRFGVTHRRRLRLTSDGNRLDGEDRLLWVDGLASTMPKEADVRFHLHPGVAVAREPGEATALLRPPTGQPWRIACDSRFAVEESVYFGSGSREAARQIVISKSLNDIRETGETVIRWTLSRAPQQAP